MKKILLMCLAFGLLQSSAHAHTGLEGIEGFASGFSHPFLGLDHVLVMLGIGLWASRLGSKVALATVFTFLSFMSAGAVLAWFGMDLQGVELGIISSVVVMGAVLSAPFKLPATWVALLLGSFALLHGYAHGLEIPSAAEPMGYAMGFVVASSTLHVLGWAAGLFLTRFAYGPRVCGYLTCGAGLWLLMS